MLRGKHPAFLFGDEGVERVRLWPASAGHPPVHQSPLSVAEPGRPPDGGDSGWQGGASRAMIDRRLQEEGEGHGVQDVPEKVRAERP